MAVAFRLSDLDRIFINLDWDGVFSGDLRFSLRSGAVHYHLQNVDGIRGGIATTDISFYFERLLMNFRATIPLLDIVDMRSNAIVHSEPLSFHPSVFLPFFDFARSERFPPFTGESFAKPEMLAVFTHVYNEDEMLTMWERHYAKLVAHRHLYVVDHGSEVSPKTLLRPDTKIITIPRGVVDHANIAGFCHYFQRFLLTQYRWVIHVDADEFLVDEGGPANLLAKLAAIDTGAIIQPRHGYDLIHDPRSEPALVSAEPVSLQRRILKPSPGYAKPAIASVPTTWGLGFHFAFEQDKIVEDAALWMIHLAFADLRRNLGRQMKWKHAAKSQVAAIFVPESGRDDTIEELAKTFDRMLARDGIEMPEWMRGMF